MTINVVPAYNGHYGFVSLVSIEIITLLLSILVLSHQQDQSILMCLKSNPGLHHMSLSNDPLTQES